MSADKPAPAPTGAPSLAEAQSTRADFKAALPGIAKMHGWQPHEMAQREAEFMKNFDDQMRDRYGLDVTQPAVDPGVARLHNDTGIPMEPKTSDYDFRGMLSASSRLTVAGIGQAAEWSAALKLSPHLASGLISHLQELGTRHAGLSVEEGKRHATNVRLGLEEQIGKAAVDEMMAKVEKVLALGGEIGGLSNTLRTHPAAQSPWLWRTLALHWDQLEKLAAGRAALARNRGA